MSSYYNYYLEYKSENGWIQLNNLENDGKMIYYHTRSYGSNFAYHYLECYLPFEQYSIEIQKEYEDAYKNSTDEYFDFAHYYPKYAKMDLERMVNDYYNNIHEFAGIITKNDCLKIQDEGDYIPEIITPSDFNALPDTFKEKYVFYAWDSPWSEYGHIYDIVPIVSKLLEINSLSLNQVRLTFYIS